MHTQFTMHNAQCTIEECAFGARDAHSGKPPLAAAYVGALRSPPDPFASKASPERIIRLQRKTPGGGGVPPFGTSVYSKG